MKLAVPFFTSAALISLFALSALPQIPTPKASPIEPNKTSKPAGTTLTGGKVKPPVKTLLKQSWPIAENGPTGSLPNITSTDNEIRALFDQMRAFLIDRKPGEALTLVQSAEKKFPNRFEIQFMLGTCFAANRKYEEAANAFRKSISLNAQFADSFSGLCQSLIVSNKSVDAIEACREATRLSPQNPRFLAQLGTAYLVSDMAGDAVRVIESAPIALRNNIAAVGTLADAYFLNLEYDRAATAYEKIGKDWPAVPFTFLRLSQVYDYLDRPKESIVAARKFADLEPKLAFAFFNLGEKLQTAGFFDESIEPLKKALELDPALGEAAFRISESYAVSGDSDSALPYLQKAYHLLPRTPGIALRLGSALMGIGAYAESVEPYELANALRPNDPDIMRSLGIAYSYVRRYDEAVDLVEKAAKIAPLPPGTKIDFSGFRDRQKLIDRLEQDLEYVKKNPASVEARRELIAIYKYKGMLDEAEQQFLEIIKLRPDDYDSFNRLAIFYYDNGHVEKALAAARKAAELNPHHVLYLSIALKLKRLGRLDEAIEAARRAVELKPTYLDDHLILAELLEKKGRREEVFRELQTAFNLAPDDVTVNSRLVWFYIRTGNKDGAVKHFYVLKRLVPTSLENLELCMRAHFGSF